MSEDRDKRASAARQTLEATRPLSKDMLGSLIDLDDVDIPEIEVDDELFAEGQDIPMSAVELLEGSWVDRPAPAQTPGGGAPKPAQIVSTMSEAQREATRKRVTPLASPAVVGLRRPSSQAVGRVTPSELASVGLGPERQPASAEVARGWLSQLAEQPTSGRWAFAEVGVWFRVQSGRLLVGAVHGGRIAWELGGGEPPCLTKEGHADIGAALEAADDCARRDPDGMQRWLAAAILRLTQYTTHAPRLVQYSTGSADLGAQGWSAEDLLTTPPLAEIAQIAQAAQPLPAEPAEAFDPNWRGEGALYEAFEARLGDAEAAALWGGGGLRAVKGWGAVEGEVAEAVGVAVGVEARRKVPQVTQGQTPQTLIFFGAEGFWLRLRGPDWVGLMRFAPVKLGAVLNTLRERGL